MFFNVPVHSDKVGPFAAGWENGMIGTKKTPAFCNLFRPHFFRRFCEKSSALPIHLVCSANRNIAVSLCL
jgi:hypothetical protein